MNTSREGEAWQAASPADRSLPAGETSHRPLICSGEDGPTDAAGAVIDSDLLDRLRGTNVDPANSLARNDAYTFFEQTNGLVRTGPTHTNVCDVRVVVVDRAKPDSG